MKKLFFASLAAGLLGVVAACSQGQTHPGLLSDCDACNNPIIPVGSSGDSGTADATDGAVALDASDAASSSDAADESILFDAGASE